MSLVCSSELCSLMLNWVVPILGNITAMMTTVSPISEVLRIRATGRLGKTNPIPYAFIFLNAIVWLQYGILIGDIFVAAPNLVGSLVGLYFTRSAYAYASAMQRRTLDILSLGGTLLVYSATLVSSLYLSQTTARLVMGLTANGILALFYTSPLAVLATVVRERDASIFSPPLALACLINGGLWSAYGVVLGDPFVWAPNALGATLAAVQFVLRLVFPGGRHGIHGDTSTETVVQDDAMAKPLAHSAVVVVDSEEFDHIRRRTGSELRTTAVYTENEDEATPLTPTRRPAPLLRVPETVD